MKKPLLNVLAEILDLNNTEKLRAKIAEPGFLESMDLKTAKVVISHFYQKLEMESNRKKSQSIKTNKLYF